ncbi:MAG: flagellar export protein FliJ [bacterium]|nr:flagellar export protein FliJ [bacterium]
MSRFRYRMQNILDVKSKLEEQARMEFALANRALQEEEEKLETLKQRKQAYEDEIVRLLHETLQLDRIKENEQASKTMDELIAAQQLQVRAAERKVDAARAKLQAVMQERKTHEKLRERAFDEFVQEENAKESKEIDELTSYRYGQKEQE